ncbi:transcriptional repressor LexA [Salinibius halmophilus]|uniref:transcriptional repressor LexA n=1 Tax=Salinibius halmophilus TaxID=1853216 RepID=UPI000E661522|nr:transcriptional repressor LexA [Salinibius halmophilus]
MKLTARQQEILQLIKNHIEETGYPPTRAEIAKHFGFKSPNAAEAHLRALAKKGAIEMVPGASRGIRLADDAANESGLAIIGRVAAGSPILAEQHIEQRAAVASNFFSPAADYLLRVQGTSMINAGIFEDDLIAVHRTSDVKNGDIVVARVDGDVTVKRWLKQGNKVQLIPENDELSPIEVDASHELSVEGLCVGVIRQH